MLTRPDPPKSGKIVTRPDPTRPAGPSDPWTTLVPTGWSNSWTNSCVVWTVVQPVGPTGWTNQTCQIHSTGWTNSCVVKTFIQLSGRQFDQLYMQMRSLNQPIGSTYNYDASNDVIFSYSSVHRRNLPSLSPCSDLVTTLVTNIVDCAGDDFFSDDVI